MINLLELLDSPSKQLIPWKQIAKVSEIEDYPIPSLDSTTLGFEEKQSMPSGVQSKKIKGQNKVTSNDLSKEAIGDCLEWIGMLCNNCNIAKDSYEGICNPFVCSVMPGPAPVTKGTVSKLTLRGLFHPNSITAVLKSLCNAPSLPLKRKRQDLDDCSLLPCSIVVARGFPDVSRNAHDSSDVIWIISGDTEGLQTNFVRIKVEQ
jgi:hypothetical protein